MKSYDSKVVKLLPEQKVNEPSEQKVSESTSKLQSSRSLLVTIGMHKVKGAKVY